MAQVNPGGARSFLHTDRHGSIVALTQTDITSGPYAYDAYGNCFLNSAPCTAADIAGEPYRFAGMRIDPETGLYYDRARYYTPTLGRFLQTDPVGYTADLNLYTYVGNDPLDKSDPTGTQMLCTTGSHIKDTAAIGCNVDVDSLPPYRDPQQVAGHLIVTAITDTVTSIENVASAVASGDPSKAGLLDYATVITLPLGGEGAEAKVAGRLVGDSVGSVAKEEVGSVADHAICIKKLGHWASI